MSVRRGIDGHDRSSQISKCTRDGFFGVHLGVVGVLGAERPPIANFQLLKQGHFASSRASPSSAHVAQDRVLVCMNGHRLGSR